MLLEVLDHCCEALSFPLLRRYLLLQTLHGVFELLDIPDEIALVLFHRTVLGLCLPGGIASFQTPLQVDLIAEIRMQLMKPFLFLLLALAEPELP